MALDYAIAIQHTEPAMDPRYGLTCTCTGVRTTTPVYLKKENAALEVSPPTEPVVGPVPTAPLAV